MADTRLAIGTVISGVMMAVGIFVGARLLVYPDAPLTGNRLLDFAFALFFLVRGGLYFWTMRRRTRG